MNWKKVVDSKDFLSYEKKSRNLKVRIEARYQNKEWVVYKTYFDEKNLRVVEEFMAKDSKKLNKLINKLMNEKDYSKKTLIEINKESKKKISLELKRAYKEYEFEKWFFGINDGEKNNVIIVHYSESIDVDVILNENYRFLCNKIIDALEKTLGIDGIDKKLNIYYYNYKLEKKEKYKKPEFLLGKIELDMEATDD